MAKLLPEVKMLPGIPWVQMTVLALVLLAGALLVQHGLSLSTCKATPLTNADIRTFMTAHYGRHDARHGWLRKRDYDADGTLLKSHFICASLSAEVAGEPQLFMAVCNRNEDRRNWSAATASQFHDGTDFYQLRKTGGGVSIVAMLESENSFEGSAGVTTVVKMGRDAYGFQQTGPVMFEEQGCGGDESVMFAPREKIFSEVLDQVVTTDTGTFPALETSGAVTLAFDRSQPDLPVYPLTLTRETSRWDNTREDPTTQMSRKTYVLKFDDRHWQYILPKSYKPLEVNC